MRINVRTALVVAGTGVLLMACSSTPAHKSALPGGAADLVDDYVKALNDRDSSALKPMFGAGSISDSDRATEATKRLSTVGGRGLKESNVVITAQDGDLWDVTITLIDSSGSQVTVDEAIIEDGSGNYKLGTEFVGQQSPSSADGAASTASPSNLDLSSGAGRWLMV